MNDAFYKSLSDALCGLDIAVSEETSVKFAKYADLLIERGKNVNLTAITDQSEIAVKHFADSLALLKHIDITHGARIIDVGTGAGFPGVPLLIARPDLSLMLIDSTDKKLKFVREACAEIGISPEIAHIRAEDAGRDPSFREKYDIAVSRAVADLRVLTEYCLPFVKKGGFFAPYKGEVKNELENAQNAVSELSGKVEAVFEYSLCGCGKRNIIIIKKISQTSPKYPRITTQILKKPL